MGDHFSDEMVEAKVVHKVLSLGDLSAFCWI